MRRWMRGIMMGAAAITIAAAAEASTVQYDMDREIAISSWSSWAWRGPDAAVSIQERRIRRALADGFRGRGYTMVDSPILADFVVAYHATAWKDVQVQATYYGPGFGRYARVDRIPMGALMVDVYERRTGRLAWHGLVSDALADDANEAEAKTTKAVAKLLKKFPERKEPK